MSYFSQDEDEDESEKKEDETAEGLAAHFIAHVPVPSQKEVMFPFNHSIVGIIKVLRKKNILNL